MSNPPVQDQRKFFMLPQGYEGGGYYCYGTPGDGAGQYAHPRLISAIQAVAMCWRAHDERKFGIGNISIAEGAKFSPHATHRSGLEVDIRLLRTDGLRLPCTYRQHVYDRDGTAKLIGIFRALADVDVIYLNDVKIRGVRSSPGHDNHFHITLR